MGATAAGSRRLSVPGPAGQQDGQAMVKVSPSEHPRKLKMSPIPGSELRTYGTVEVIAEQQLPPTLDLRYRGTGVA